MFIQETHLNNTENYLIGESPWYEPFTDDLGKLFKSLQKKWGRCTGTSYVDSTNGESQTVGWVFQKRLQYDGATSKRDTFLRETWVRYRYGTSPPHCQHCKVIYGTSSQVTT